MESNKPQKLYKTIMTDPPWDIEQKGARGAVRHYRLMTLDQIKAMPVADLADPEGSHCWLWVTAATLRHGYDVLEAWGYTPRSPFIWIKPRLGLGVYLRNAAEFMLLGTRGKCPVLYKAQPNWLFAPVQPPHSHKPEEQYPIIERVSPGPYLELFARRRQPGWDAWGNEMPDSDIVIPGYPVPSDKNHRRED
jgi:N6-adenosine-specific RNA methylase IME4